MVRRLLPGVFEGWIVVAADSTPLPRRSDTSSFSHGMSFGVAPGARPAAMHAVCSEDVR